MTALFTVLFILIALSNTARAIFPAKLGAGKYFDRAMFLVFENHSQRQARADVNFAKYNAMGLELTNYFAITHPSQPNYLTFIAGDYFNLQDNNNVDLPHASIVDLLEASGLTWKSYQEGFPGACNPSMQIGRYYRKHNPFMSFTRITANATRCANIVGFDAFDADLLAGQLPNYMFLTPDIVNDGHDTSVLTAGAWLDSFLSTRLARIPANTVIFITWDEDDRSQNNQVLTTLLPVNCSAVQPGTSDNRLYTHYSTLRTVQDNWSLGSLGRQDSLANSIILSSSNGTQNTNQSAIPTAKSNAFGLVPGLLAFALTICCSIAL